MRRGCWLAVLVALSVVLVPSSAWSVELEKVGMYSFSYPADGVSGNPDSVTGGSVNVPFVSGYSGEAWTGRWSHEATAQGNYGLGSWSVASRTITTTTVMVVWFDYEMLATVHTSNDSSPRIWVLNDSWGSFSIPYMSAGAVGFHAHPYFSTLFVGQVLGSGLVSPTLATGGIFQMNNGITARYCQIVKFVPDGGGNLVPHFRDAGYILQAGRWSEVHGEGTGPNVGASEPLVFTTPAWYSATLLDSNTSGWGAYQVHTVFAGALEAGALYSQDASVVAGVWGGGTMDNMMAWAGVGTEAGGGGGNWWDSLDPTAYQAEFEDMWGSVSGVASSTAGWFWPYEIMGGW